MGEGKLSSKFSEIANKDKVRRIIIIVGIIGILIILISSLIPKNKKKSTSNDNNKTSDEYTLEMENKLKDIVSSINGVGRTNIMLTLENGTEYIYANDDKSTKDNTEDVNGTDGKKTQTKENNENKTIIIDNPEGGEKALVKTEVEPRIKGVIVVCDGGDNALVQERIINAVTVALDISPKRVCVTKIKA